MMKKLLLVTILAAFAYSEHLISAFTAHSSRAWRIKRPSGTKLAVSRSIPEQDQKTDTSKKDLFFADEEIIQERHEPSSPAVILGKPLDDAAKKFNHDTVGFIKTLLFDTLFAGDTMDRAFARFYALETIARIPYFSYLSVLHLYETLGLWRRADYIKLHFAESWNELHHLLIFEELGGNDKWFDRFVAQHVAISYYWIVILAYMVNPSFAYNLNQAIEEHAYDTYATFVKEHEEWLKTQPAPEIAKKYYLGEDPYMFEEFHISTEVCRPKCENLYDVICNVRDDEMEHVKTMKFLQELDSDLVGVHSEEGLLHMRECELPENY